MNKKMDVNLAFAILLLVAAIVAMYFWLENADEDVKDIYDSRQEASIPRDNESEVVDGDVEAIEGVERVEEIEATESVESSSEDIIVQ